MLSYISSSDSKKWYASWLIMALLVVSFLSAYEMKLKQNGYQKSISSDKNLWSYYRSQASDNDSALVILGGSRAQLGIDMQSLRQAYPDKDIVGLTVNGQYPLATFEAFANDESFRGEIWLSIVAQALEPDYWDMQLPHNLYYEKESSFNQRLNAFLSAQFQYLFRFNHPELSFKNIIQGYDSASQFPKPFYVSEQVDLSKHGDYSKTNSEHLVKHFVAQKEKNYIDHPPMTLEVFDQQVKKLSALIDKIRQRGGRVMIVRMPTDKGHWQLDDKYYPKNQYWDRMAKTLGVKMVHFKEHPGLSKFELPDSSHMDVKNIAEFTQNMIQIIGGE